MQHFTTLHEGLAPQALTCEPFRGPTGAVRLLGRITEIQYRKRTPKGLEAYWHPFEPHAQPKFGLDASGNPVIWAGRYQVLDGGITDRSPRSVRPESIPRNPQTLADLGLLQWIRYDSEREQRSRTLRYSSRSLLAHDERGNLYVLPSGPHEENMKRRSAKRNPIALTGHGGREPTAGDILLAFGLVGGGMAIATELLGALPPRINGYKRPLVQAAIGMGLGYAAAKTESIPREVALSLGASGAIAGLLGVKAEFMMQRSLGASVRGGGAAQLGQGGLPHGYNAVSRAQCPVGAR